MERRILLICLVLRCTLASAQLGKVPNVFTHADSLRGSIGPDRIWWDVVHYDVNVKPDFDLRSIVGVTTIAFDAVADGEHMQIDLQQPLVVDSITTEVAVFKDGSITVTDARISFTHQQHVILADLPQPMKKGESTTVTIYYHGVPRAAKHPPWDGGWIWKKDAQGNPWMSVACQGLGASVWYPCKDHQSDEPESAALHITVPDSLQAIGNGRLRSTIKNADGTTTWNWSVTNPINNYNLIPYIGKYAHFAEVYKGLVGPLDCDYWVLAYNEEKAREHFKQVPLMLACFEDWLGPYPFYSDGYKLVESPHLGMEHQSAIAYGNGYQNGYLGSDRSGTGVGLNWDYIIIHESGHEWFGNNITTADIADMWIHEGFTDYTETIYTECQQGTEAGETYVVGLRKGIANDRPLIGPYGVNQEGSGDMYNKGANLIHTIRHIMANDSLFKAMLREMNTRFHHQVTTSAEVEAFISAFSGHDFSKVFDQYLRTTHIPVLEWGIHKKELWARLVDVEPGLRMPVRIMVGDKSIMPILGERFGSCATGLSDRTRVEIDRNWYLITKRISRKQIRSAVRSSPPPLINASW